MAADGGGKASRFRWLYAARCAVAFVVTLIAVVVLVRAVVVMLRPEKLQLRVTGGSVSVNRIPSMPPRTVTLNFTLKAYNPSDRCFLELSRVNIRLLDNNASMPGPVKITEFPYPYNISLAQQTAQASLVTTTRTPPDDVPMSYVRELFNGLSVTAEMEVDVLLSDCMKGINTRNITYYCWPVTIAVGGSSLSSPSGNSRDTNCLDKSEAPSF